MHQSGNNLHSKLEASAGVYDIYRLKSRSQNVKTQRVAVLAFTDCSTPVSNGR